MAGKLAVRPVNDADSAFQPRTAQHLLETGLCVAMHGQDQPRKIGQVKQMLVALRMGGPDVHDFHWSIPVTRGRNGSVVRPETDQKSVLPEMLLAKLTQIVFAP